MLQEGKLVSSPINEAQKILIVGCSGSGKSTLTGILAKKFDLPPVHLDIHFWNPGWVQTPRDQWRAKVKELVKAPRWIMDGTFSESFDLRFPVADIIIIIDFHPLLCLWRAYTRVLKYKKSDHRPDMAEGCHEKIDFAFYKYILTYRKLVFPRVLSALKEYNSEEKTIFLRSQSEVDSFIRQWCG